MRPASSRPVPQGHMDLGGVVAKSKGLGAENLLQPRPIDLFGMSVREGAGARDSLVAMPRGRQRLDGEQLGVEAKLPARPGAQIPVEQRGRLLVAALREQRAGAIDLVNL